jgi:hypothetical protein
MQQEEKPQPEAGFMCTPEGCVKMDAAPTDQTVFLNPIPEKPLSDPGESL